MFGAKKGFLGGLITVFFLSIVVFFVIYLLVPEVSLKFFGIAVNSDQYVQRAISSSVSSLDLPPSIADDLTAYLSSAEGQAFIEEAQNAVGGAAEGAIEFFSSDAFKSFMEEAGEFIAAGAGSISQFVAEHAGDIQ